MRGAETMMAVTAFIMVAVLIGILVALITAEVRG